MYCVKQRMLAFYIIADIVPLGLYRQQLCKSCFTGMLIILPKDNLRILILI